MSLEVKLKERYKQELDVVDDVEELILDGLATIDKISPSDKQYLERFKSLAILSMNLLGLTTVENIPVIPSLMSVCSIHSSFS